MAGSSRARCFKVKNKVRKPRVNVEFNWAGSIKIFKAMSKR